MACFFCLCLCLWTSVGGCQGSPQRACCGWPLPESVPQAHCALAPAAPPPLPCAGARTSSRWGRTPATATSRRWAFRRAPPAPRSPPSTATSPCSSSPPRRGCMCCRCRCGAGAGALLRLGACRQWTAAVCALGCHQPSSLAALQYSNPILITSDALLICGWMGNTFMLELLQELDHSDQVGEGRQEGAVGGCWRCASLREADLAMLQHHGWAPGSPRNAARAPAQHECCKSSSVCAPAAGPARGQPRHAVQRP